MSGSATSLEPTEMFSQIIHASVDVPASGLCSQTHLCGDGGAAADDPREHALAAHGRHRRQCRLSRGAQARPAADVGEMVPAVGDQLVAQVPPSPLGCKHLPGG